MTFLPFKNESNALTIGDLKIENHEDHIALYGRLMITRDRAGLEAAKALKALFEKIVHELENGPNLPVHIAAADAPKKVKNPFGHA